MRFTNEINKHIETFLPFWILRHYDDSRNTNYTNRNVKL